MPNVTTNRIGGMQPKVIECLNVPPSKAQLRQLRIATGIKVGGLLQENGTPYPVLDYILNQPFLVNRPFVATSLLTLDMSPYLVDLKSSAMRVLTH